MMYLGERALHLRRHVPGNPTPCPGLPGKNRTRRRLTPAHWWEALLLAHTVGVLATGPARRAPGPGRWERGQGRENHPYTTAPPRHRAPAVLAAQTRRPGTAHSG